MRAIGSRVRVVTARSEDDPYQFTPSRYAGTIGEVISVEQEKPILYKIKTITAKEWGEPIVAGFTLLAFADELRTTPVPTPTVCGVSVADTYSTKGADNKG